MRLKTKDIQKMNEKERIDKIKELNMELIKSSINSSKTGGSKAREIRRIIAKLLTLNKKQN